MPLPTMNREWQLLPLSMDQVVSGCSRLRFFLASFLAFFSAFLAFLSWAASGSLTKESCAGDGCILSARASGSQGGCLSALAPGVGLPRGRTVGLPCPGVDIGEKKPEVNGDVAAGDDPRGEASVTVGLAIAAPRSRSRSPLMTLRSPSDAARDSATAQRSS